MTGERYTAFDTFLHRNVLSQQIARVKVWNDAGMTIYSDDAALYQAKTLGRNQVCVKV